MKTFVFNEKNGSASIILSESNYDEAIEYLKNLGVNPNHFEYEDEEGEDEDDFDPNDNQQFMPPDLNLI